MYVEGKERKNEKKNSEKIYMQREEKMKRKRKKKYMVKKGKLEKESKCI